jgi:hypothetical protein
MSTSAEHLVAVNTPVERRFYPRIAPSALIYVAFGQNNDGMLLNVSENGLLVSTPERLDRNFVSRVLVRLNDLPKVIQVCVRVVWTSESQKRAGIQLIDLSEYDREQIRKWGALETSRQIEKEQLPAATEPPKTPHSAAATPSRGDTNGSAEAVAASVFDRVASDRTAPPADARFGEPQHEPWFQVRQAAGRPSRAKARDSTITTSLWVAVPVVIALGIILLLRSGALHNPLIPSAEGRKDDAGATAAMGPELGIKGPSMPIPTHGGVKASGDDRSFSTRHNASSESALWDFPVADSRPVRKTLNGEDGVPVTPESARSDATDPRADALGMNGAITPAAAPDLIGGGSAADHPRSRNVGAPNPTDPNDLSTNKPSESASNPIVASTHAPNPAARRVSFLARKSEPGVASESAVMDVRPESRSTSFQTLPGERVLESASVTTRIQRSVLMPGEHKWWPIHRSKKVALGELLSRVDPQVSNVPSAPGATVTVRAIVAADGHIESVQPVHGPMTLVPAVVRAVREWHYQPTLLDGKPVETQADVEVQFHTTTGGVGKP